MRGGQTTVDDIYQHDKARQAWQEDALTVGEWRCMLDAFSAEDYEDLVFTVMDKLQMDFSRKSFVHSNRSEKVKPVLMQCIMEMVARYLELYKTCMRGKVCSNYLNIIILKL